MMDKNHPNSPYYDDTPFDCLKVSAIWDDEIIYTIYIPDEEFRRDWVERMIQELEDELVHHAASSLGQVREDGVWFREAPYRYAGVLESDGYRDTAELIHTLEHREYMGRGRDGKLYPKEYRIAYADIERYILSPANRDKFITTEQLDIREIPTTARAALEARMEAEAL